MILTNIYNEWDLDNPKRKYNSNNYVMKHDDIILNMMIV